MKKAIPFIILAVCVLIVITTSIVQFVALHPNTNTPTTTPPPSESTSPTTPPETLPASIMPDGVYTLVAGNFCPYLFERESLEYLLEYTYYTIVISDGILSVKHDGFWMAFDEHGGEITLEHPNLLQNAFTLNDEQSLQLQYQSDMDCIVLTSGESIGYFKRFESTNEVIAWLSPFFNDMPAFTVPTDLSWYESFGDEIIPPIEENASDSNTNTTNPNNN